VDTPAADTPVELVVGEEHMLTKQHKAREQAAELEAAEVRSLPAWCGV
jgi:hypothetical protein